MAPPEVWGPPIWTFFHTLAEKIKEEEYPRLGPQLFTFIRRILQYLPCPNCSQHAGKFVNQMKPEQYATKTDLKTMLFMFHNKVNARKNKPIFNHADLDKYVKINLLQVHTQFIRVYNTKGNMNALTESFQRKLLLKDLKIWLVSNMSAFTQ